jgi:hypothetical protein
MNISMFCQQNFLTGNVILLMKGIFRRPQRTSDIAVLNNHFNAFGSAEYNNLDFEPY